MDGTGKAVSSPEFIAWFTQWSTAGVETPAKPSSVWQRILSFFRAVITVFARLIG